MIIIQKETRYTKRNTKKYEQGQTPLIQCISRWIHKHMCTTQLTGRCPYLLLLRLLPPLPVTEVAQFLQLAPKTAPSCSELLIASLMPCPRSHSSANTSNETIDKKPP